MNNDIRHSPADDGHHHASTYQAPAIIHLGSLADLTRVSKTVNGADGSTFLGLDIGSV